MRKFNALRSRGHRNAEHECSEWEKLFISAANDPAIRIFHHWKPMSDGETNVAAVGAMVSLGGFLMGVISLVAAVVAPFLGFVRLQRFVQWWTRRSPGFVRGWSVMVAAFGVFLFYGAM